MAQPTTTTGVARGVAGGLAVAVLAVVTMVAVAALGLSLLGATAVGSVWPMSVALVALATGGPVGLSGALGSGLGGLGGRGFGAGGLGGLISAQRLGGLDGTVRGMPLGVTAAGIAVIVVTLEVLRRRGGGDRRGGVARAASVGVFFPLLVGVLALAGRGTIGIGDRATVGYRTEAASAFVGACVVVLAALGLCWLLSRYAVARGVVAVVSTIMLAGTVLGCLVALWAGARVAGVALLAAPNVLVIAAAIGMGVSFSAGVTGLPASVPLSSRLPAIDLSERALAGSGRHGHLVPTLIVVLVLLAVGVLVAARTRGAGRPLCRIGLIAVWFGAVMAVVAPVGTALAAISVQAGITVLGFRLGVVGIAVHAVTARAAVAGLVYGGAAGGLGGALWLGVTRLGTAGHGAAGYGAARYRIPKRGWSHGTAPRRR